MIRRRVADGFALITQNDHARLSGQLAKLIGNRVYAPPEPANVVCRATAMHDVGWAAHDDLPTLNARGFPRHVFETEPGDIYVLDLWSASARLASEADAYAGLLVSLHVLSLSTHLSAQNRDLPPDAARVFAFHLNQFQHYQIEQQEHLRAALGLRTDLPLRLGLAEPGQYAEEDQLSRNFHLLQAMDRLSLNLCFNELVMPEARGFSPSAGEPSVPMRFSFHRGAVVVNPWPFNVDRLTFTVPYRLVSGDPFSQETAFLTAYAAAKTQQLTVEVRSPRAE